MPYRDQSYTTEPDLPGKPKASPIPAEQQEVLRRCKTTMTDARLAAAYKWEAAGKPVLTRGQEMQATVAEYARLMKAEIMAMDIPEKLKEELCK